MMTNDLNRFWLRIKKTTLLSARRLKQVKQGWVWTFLLLLTVNVITLGGVLLPTILHKESKDDGPAEIGEALHTAIEEYYQFLLSRKQGIFQTDINDIVSKYIFIGTTFTTAKDILKGTGFSTPQLFGTKEFQQHSKNRDYVSTFTLGSSIVGSITAVIHLVLGNGPLEDAKVDKTISFIYAVFL